MADMIGRELGQYQIVKLLGEGGMASVYLARQISVERDVAIKVIRQSYADDTSFVRRFNREARTVASLSHPHIVKLFDYGQQDEIVYLVMELMTDGSLHEFMQGPLSTETTLHLLEQIASALDYAHRRGVIHRDLKPQNVLLDEEKNAFLTDFGISKLILDQSALQASSDSDMFAGTPAYASPEQWTGGAIDARADLYSLGIMLFEMICGRRPFDGETPFRMMHQHTYEAPPPPSTINRALPSRVDIVLAKALAKTPISRYESATALFKAFADAVSPNAAPKPTVSDPKRKTHSDDTVKLAPRKPIPAEEVAATVSDITGPIESIVESGSAESVPAIVTYPRRWRSGGVALFGVAIVALIVAGGVLFSSHSFDSNLGSGFSSTGTPSSTRIAPPTQTSEITATSANLAPPVISQPSPTQTATNTPTVPPPTASEAPSTTSTQVPSATPTPTNTDSPIATLTNTLTATATHTDTLTATATATPTASLTATYSPTLAPTSTMANTQVPTFAPTQVTAPRIAYISRSGTLQGITRITADGTNSQQLTHTNDHYLPPLSWSPAIREFVFSTRSNTSQIIWTADDDGLATVVTQGSNPVWSPDGKYIAFLVSGVVKGQQVYQIYLKTQDGDQFVLTPTGVKSAFLVWSPDGRHLAAISNGIVLIDVPSGDINAKLMTATPQPPVRLNNDSHALAATWSPNGEYLAVALTTGQGFYVLNVSTGEQKVLAATQAAPTTAPSWSPDGSRLVYSSAGHIYIINADGSGQKLLSEGLEPSWSPDGTKIAYSLQSKVYVMDITGANIKLLGDGTSPIWLR